MATITDVCRLAGVSKATVSRVLNNTGPVKESTRESVLNAMEALSYRPNTLAQALANQRTETIGLVLPEFVGGYFGRLLQQAARSADEAGRQLIVTDGHDNVECEQQIIDMLVYRRCDAIVLYSRAMSDEQLARLMRELPVPLVALNRYVAEAPERSFMFEQEGATRMAAEYMIGLGHRQVACITPRLESRTGQLRLQGYLAALQAHGITVDPALISAGAFSATSGYHACRRLLETGKRFTALLCCSDMMAEGAYRALAERGLSIPDDVSVFGIDNDPAAAYMIPALSTVKLPVGDMTRMAVEQAVRLADGLPVTASGLFPGKMILRESVVSPGTAFKMDQLASPLEPDEF